MPTVNAGSIASIHCPLDSTITVTPGATAKVSVQSVSSPSFLAATITDAKTLPVTAGDLVIITAIDADVTYTDPALSAAQLAAVQNILAIYDYQPATWYAGEINSVVTPSITADGDLSTATDQVPLKWLVVINADDDVAAAQALMDGGPNVIEILPGAQAQPPVYADGSETPEVITRIYAVCISSSAAPADYTGGAYILSDADTDIADALANMARFEFSSGLGATVARLVATPVYDTHYTQLSVAAGVVA